MGLGFSASFLEIRLRLVLGLGLELLDVGSPCLRRVSSDGVMIVASIGMSSGISGAP